MKEMVNAFDYAERISKMLPQGILLNTSGEKFNSMVIGWGHLGVIWNLPTFTAYVRQSRYTQDFMDKNEYFTVSFYPEDCRKTLGVLGSRSGREMDKMHGSGLTPVAAGPSMSFAEAECTLVCKKLFMQPLETARIPAEIAQAFYQADAPHDMYIGEVVEIIKA